MGMEEVVGVKKKEEGGKKTRMREEGRKKVRRG